MKILAIVGRPNVGKSALFNRIARRKIAIVHEQSGVTRDRISASAEWGGRTFEVVDTGGIAFVGEEKTPDVLLAATRAQAEVAISMADAIVLVVDVTAGLVPLDEEIAAKLRSSGKKVFLAVNKVDNERREKDVVEFARLGFDPLFPIAAVHGTGVGALLDVATRDFPEGAPVAAAAPLRVAILGRPNVGKSSLVNRLLGSDRTIVSEQPGTTRDSVDVPLIRQEPAGERHYVLVDTAGLRHRRKIKSSVDQFGLMRAERSIRHCDVAVLVLDAAEGVTRHDKHIAGQIVEAGRGCIILVNKWDLMAETDRRAKGEGRRGKGKSFRTEFLATLRRELFFLEWAAVLLASARTGEGVEGLFALLARVEAELDRRVETPRLNQLLSRCLQAYPPPLVSGKRLKIYYAFQAPGRPPTFTLFVNDARTLTPHYRRFLADKIRAAWDFTGCPLEFRLKPKIRRKFTKSTRG